MKRDFRKQRIILTDDFNFSVVTHALHTVFYNILELICFFIIAGLRLNIRLAVLMEVIPATIIGTDKITNFI